jgi:hypothetical protein
VCSRRSGAELIVIGRRMRREEEEMERELE